MSWIEKYLYAPNFAQKCLAIVLLPLSFIWAALASLRAVFSPRYSSQIPVISVGNLSAGGNNKSPFTRELARFLTSDESAKMLQQPPYLPEQIAIILRGYGRKSSGLLELSCIDARRFGDEACEHKMLLEGCKIFVSSDRIAGIKAAEKAGCKVAILDDAFAKFGIKKFDFLLESAEPKYLPFCLPAGPLRLPRYFAKRADFIARANIHYELISSAPDDLGEYFFASAIAKPERLEHIYSRCAGRLLLADHAVFDAANLRRLMHSCGAKKLLCTGKDAPKLLDFAPQVISLKINLSPQVKKALINYLKGYKNE